MDRDLAENLYTGILTDTGSFRYSSTTPRSMMIASRLLRCGLDPYRISEQIYDSTEYSSLRLMGEVLSRLGRSRDGKLAWVTIPHRLLTRLTDPAETEDFINYPRSLATARAALAFKEVRPGEIRISFRSKGEADMAKLAARYGGGGHRSAAGCTVEGKLKEVEKRILSETHAFLEESAG
jgi:phosphoesterase RecJ-like protein